MSHRPSSAVSLCSLAGFVLSLMTGCLERTAWLGGADHFNIPENQTPHIAITAFRQSHPDGQIDWIESVISNSSPVYLIHYHEAHEQGSGARYLYSPLMYRPTMHVDSPPPEVIGTLERLYPGAVLDRAEFFSDTAQRVEFYSLHFHVGSGPSQRVSIDPNGEVCHSLLPEN
jgi:hypothetical protein